MQIHLLIDYYTNPREERASELNFCFFENINNKCFDHVHIFAQSELPISILPDNVTVTRITQRLTYQYYIEYAKTNIPQGDVVVLSNADIFFDESIAKVNDVDLSNKVLALTRFCPFHGHWVDEQDNVIPYHNHDRSQDVWIWSNPLREGQGDFNFNIGTLGCDNKVAYQFALLGYQVWNPSYSIIAYHKHVDRNDEADHYNNAPKIWHSRPYLLPKACSIEHMADINYKYFTTIEY